MLPGSWNKIFKRMWSVLYNSKISHNLRSSYSVHSTMFIYIILFKLLPINKNNFNRAKCSEKGFMQNFRKNVCKPRSEGGNIARRKGNLMVNWANSTFLILFHEISIPFLFSPLDILPNNLNIIRNIASHIAFYTVYSSPQPRYFLPLNTT